MTNELTDTYIALAQKIYDMEDQLVRVLPLMIENTTNTKLTMALTTHLAETEKHRTRMEKALKDNGQASERDSAFEKMLENTVADMVLITDESVRDAFIIASASTVEHIEIAKYTTLILWAKQLGLSEAQELFEANLAEEEAAAENLASIAADNFFATGSVEETAT